MCSSDLKQILYGLVALLVVGGLSYQSYVYAQTWKSDISIWEHARKINPYSSYPHSQLAKAYQESGDPHKAAALYKKASELTERGNSNIILRRRAAMAYGEAKEYELAIREYRALLRQSPQLGDVAFEMGWTYLLSGNEPEAEATFNRVLEKNPEHGWSYFGLAEMAFKKGDDEKGRNLYTLALNHSSDSVLVQTIIKNLQVRSKQS